MEYMKKFKKFLFIISAMSLLSSNMVYADTRSEYPDCVMYDYQTGEETIIPAGSFMSIGNTRMK